MIILGVRQCLENNVQMCLASDQLYLPALTHINMIYLCSVIYKSGISCRTLIFYCVSTQREYLQEHFICARKMEEGQMCAETVIWGAVFCETAASPSVGSKHTERKPSLSFKCPAEEFPSQPHGHTNCLLVLLV